LNFSKKLIWVITDGSQGMISQGMGLAQQFNNNILSIKTNLLFPWSKLQPGILPIFPWIFLNDLNFTSPPDIVISCGRKSVYLSIYLKKKYKNIINIHIQNPKTNFKYFNYIIAPEHDSIRGNNVINSIGALHKFNKNIFKEVLDDNFSLPKKNLISVIIGGSNNHYNFSIKEIEKLISKIKNLKKYNLKYNFLIIFSRRTTNEARNLIAEKLSNISRIVEDTEKNPYTYALKHSDLFIITSDSTSMISECAITGNPIYIFHLTYKRKSKRMEKFHKQFNKLNITKKLDSKNNFIPWSYNALNESERIAGILKERIIKVIS